tara:strand:- start:927 stop:2168 length:1242 start_codon:yes stop_codon:yes gene_type:complete
MQSLNKQFFLKQAEDKKTDIGCHCWLAQQCERLSIFSDIRWLGSNEVSPQKVRAGKINLKLAASISGLLVLGILLITSTIQPQISAQPTDDQFMQNGLLVLNDGRVLTGQISILERGYLLNGSSGRITMPFSNVICHARTLKEAYRKQRESMTKPTADQHTSLARWCLVNQLFAEAEQEIESALLLQPHHVAAKKMLARFDAQKPREHDFSSAESRKMMDDLLINKEFSTAQPIGGLDAELAKQFVTTIEPMLMNNCSNTSCHGTEARNNFRLTQKWNIRGNTRHITDQNLDAVLPFIDSKTPEQSRLLTVLDGRHGQNGLSVFTGARAKYQRKVLEQWTIAVGYSQAPGTKSLVNQDHKPIKPEELIPPTGIMPASYESHTISAESPLKKVREEQAFDPFNPDIFNRKVHGN